MDGEKDAPTGYPKGWGDEAGKIDLMNLKGREYVNVQSRINWFVGDQRLMIASGKATTSYVIRTDLVELDRETGWAHFMTYIRDVLGNEAVMFGSESSKDFGDYIEKASTKSMGRALGALGYNTDSAQDFNEGDRVVDAPQDRRQQGGQQNGQGNQQAAQRQQQYRQQAAPTRPAQASTQPTQSSNPAAHPDALKRASASQQADFLSDLREYLVKARGGVTVLGAKEVLFQHLPNRPAAVNWELLMKGDSDITVGEIRSFDPLFTRAGVELTGAPAGVTA